ncbi:hypothetical protein H7J81_18145 [Mycobacterium cookii]|nr:hypothetical protein [Mycobacterium cookii]
MCDNDVQRRVLCDDRGLELAELWPRIDPQFVGQHRARPFESGQGFTLPPGAVEREHQLSPSSFPQGRLGHRRLEFTDDFRGTARREQRVGPILDQRGMAFVPARLLRCARPTVRQFGDTAPEGECLLEVSHCLADVAGGSGIAPMAGRGSVPRSVDIALGEGPARSLRHDDAVAQRTAQRGDVGL